MKKILITTLSVATFLFAGSQTHLYEVTPTVGGVLPEGNTGLRNSLSYGLRLGVNTEDYIFDKLELALDHAPDVRIKNSNEETYASRFSFNIIKEYGIVPKTSLYTLIGAGYEFFGKESSGHRDDGFGNYGVGVKYAINESINIVADIRHAITFSGHNNLFYTLGLSIPFGAKTAAPAPVASVPIEPTPTPKVEVETKAPVVVVPVPVEEPDSDGDGVVDSKDKCPGTPEGVKVDEDGCIETITLRIMFGFDKSKIRTEYLDEIKSIATFLKKYTQFGVMLEGHTDSIGSEAYNQKLSKERALAVFEKLKDMGIEESRMHCKGFGENSPVASNDSDEGRALNRRVEAKIRD